MAKRWKTVRSFPNGTRNCYTIDFREYGLTYLIRGKFLYGNYDALNKLPTFDLYVGVNFWMTMVIQDSRDAYEVEAIVVVPENFVQVCLLNTGSSTPFINGLDVRPLRDTLYPQANNTQGLVLVKRYNFGPDDKKTYFRYPYDAHDRMWWTYERLTDWAQKTASAKVTVDSSETPTEVMQTAITPRNATGNIEFSLVLPSSDQPLRYISMMHFSELTDLAPSGGSRQYNITVNGELLPSGQDYTPVYLSTGSVYSEPTEYSGEYSVSIIPDPTSTLPPIINALELFYVISTTNLSTDANDASTIMAIKKNYQVHKNWMGDPCFPQSLAWAGLNCTNDDGSNPPIIKRINLSFSGLNGTISPSFANLNNIQYLDLSNNNLTGSIPDEFSQLPLFTWW